MIGYFWAYLAGVAIALAFVGVAARDASMEIEVDGEDPPLLFKVIFGLVVAFLWPLWVALAVAVVLSGEEK